jgi:hypothetical protein
MRQGQYRLGAYWSSRIEMLGPKSGKNWKLVQSPRRSFKCMGKNLVLNKKVPFAYYTRMQMGLTVVRQMDIKYARQRKYMINWRQMW